MANQTLQVSSYAFQQDGQIPSKYTCEGNNVNPPLRIDNIPAQAKSVVVILEDPDAPKGVFTHWLVWDINPSSDSIAENSDPGIMGTNSFGKIAYGGPCPPSGSHRYFFKVFALDTKLELPVGTEKEALEQAMKPHVIAEGSLMGRYAKANQQKG